MKRIIFFILGCVTFTLGTIGLFLPVLPTVPFYLATSFLWVNSSQKWHDYFTQTNWYKTHMQGIIENKEMSSSQLRKILGIVFVTLGIPFLLVDSLIMRIILATVFIAHCVFLPMYFKKKEKVVEEKIQ